jgi:hypothetical protein
VIGWHKCFIKWPPRSPEFTYMNCFLLAACLEHCVAVYDDVTRTARGSDRWRLCRRRLRYLNRRRDRDWRCLYLCWSRFGDFCTISGAGLEMVVTMLEPVWRWLYHCWSQSADVCTIAGAGLQMVVPLLEPVWRFLYHC